MHTQVATVSGLALLQTEHPITVITNQAPHRHVTSAFNLKHASSLSPRVQQRSQVCHLSKAGVRLIFWVHKVLNFSLQAVVQQGRKVTPKELFLSMLDSVFKGQS